MAIMGVAEAARRLGTSRGAVRKAIARGTLNATLLQVKRLDGSTWRRWPEYAIDDAEVERYRRDNLRPGHRRSS